MKRYTLSSSPLCEQKRKIRIQKIRQAKSLAENYIHESDETILNKLLDLDELDNAGTVFLYHSVGREVSTTELIERLLKSGKRVALPVSGDDGAMEFYLLSSLSELTPGKFGIPEPPVTRPVKPTKIAKSKKIQYWGTAQGTMIVILHDISASVSAFAEEPCSRMSSRQRIPISRYRSF